MKIDRNYNGVAHGIYICETNEKMDMENCLTLLAFTLCIN